MQISNCRFVKRDQQNQPNDFLRRDEFARLNKWESSGNFIEIVPSRHMYAQVTTGVRQSLQFSLVEDSEGLPRTSALKDPKRRADGYRKSHT